MKSSSIRSNKSRSSLVLALFVAAAAQAAPPALIKLKGIDPAVYMLKRNHKPDVSAELRLLPADVAVAVHNNAAAFAKTRGEWKAEAAKTHSAEDLGVAKTALAAIYDAKTLAFLESWGLTDHPGFIAGAVKVGKAIKDDTFVAGNAGNGSGGRDPKSLYPNSPMN